MMFEALQRGEFAFTRCYALLALSTLHKDNPKKQTFSYEKIVAQAKVEGYNTRKHTEQGIKHGLNAFQHAGIVIRSDDKKFYGLHSRFEREVSDIAKDIRAAITGAG